MIPLKQLPFIFNASLLTCIPPPFQVGGRLGGVFDVDPRRWRTIAEALTTARTFVLQTSFFSMDTCSSPPS